MRIFARHTHTFSYTSLSAYPRFSDISMYKPALQLIFAIHPRNSEKISRFTIRQSTRLFTNYWPTQTHIHTLNHDVEWNSRTHNPAGGFFLTNPWTTDTVRGFPTDRFTLTVPGPREIDVVPELNAGSILSTKIRVPLITRAFECNLHMQKSPYPYICFFSLIRKLTYSWKNFRF